MKEEARRNSWVWWTRNLERSAAGIRVDGGQFVGERKGSNPYLSRKREGERRGVFWPGSFWGMGWGGEDLKEGRSRRRNNTWITRDGGKSRVENDGEKKVCDHLPLLTARRGLCAGTGPGAPVGGLKGKRGV